MGKVRKACLLASIYTSISFLYFLAAASTCLAQDVVTRLPSEGLFSDGSQTDHYFSPHQKVADRWNSSLAEPASLTENESSTEEIFAPRSETTRTFSHGSNEDCWSIQVLPTGLIYRSYLASVKESRFASQNVYDNKLGWLWDIALGGRAAIVRYGTRDPIHPVGWELDIEGAAFPRLDPSESRDLVSTDFRFGIPLTCGNRFYQVKLAYYHLSSHLGDEYMVSHPGVERINYSRDAIVWGNSFYLTENLRFYAEASWSFQADGGAEPWEFQFGASYSPAIPNDPRGAPFMAINSHLREELNFGGNLVVQAGWEWRGDTGHLFRLGMHYYYGESDQWEFLGQIENKIGFGVWYDF